MVYGTEKLLTLYVGLTNTPDTRTGLTCRVEEGGVEVTDTKLFKF